MSRKEIPPPGSLESGLHRISGKRIFFGHQSVGADIMRGMEEYRGDCPGTSLRIFESRDPKYLSAPGLCHCRIGRNMDPVSKFSDFEQLMDSGFGETTDIAFFKLCYVDIVAGTDIDSVYRMYREMVIRLKRKYPRVKLLHVTVPVVRDYGRTIGILRKIAGRTNGRKEDNDARGRFSAWIDKEYGGDGSVFDLASWESGVIPGGMVVPASLKRFGGPLLPEYTDDGSHLNAKGRKVVAKGLIATLTGPLH